MQGQVQPGRFVLARAMVILLAACATGLLANALRPDGIPWKQDWGRFVEAQALDIGLSIASVDQAREIVSSGDYAVLDARPHSDYIAGHIPSALSVPYDDLGTAFPRAQLFMLPGQPVLVYCSGVACDESLELSRFLLQQGYSNVVLFAGGFSEWSKAGLEIE